MNVFIVIGDNVKVIDNGLVRGVSGQAELFIIETDNIEAVRVIVNRKFVMYCIMFNSLHVINVLYDSGQVAKKGYIMGDQRGTPLFYNSVPNLMNKLIELGWCKKPMEYFE